MNRPTVPPARDTEPGDAVYEEAKRLARDPDRAVRRRLARRTDLRPELLYFLAGDPEPEVRREIAENPATPVHAGLILAQDADDGVRTHLADKVAALVPALPESERGRLYEMTCQVVEILARDQLPRVRAVLAEALAEVTGADPHLAELARRLARDQAIEVASPVLERSVLLTDADLIEIINSSPAAWAVSCIARRPELGAAVSDAVVHGGEADAIAALLGNPSAQIREETLDRIVDQAPEEPSWHGLLVRRPRLSARAASRIAEFVADTLLETLRRRSDLDPDTARAVSAVVRRRLDDEAPAPAEDGAAAPQTRDSAVERAMRLHTEGTLDEAAIAQALAAGERAFAVAALVLRGNLSAEVVRAILASGSPKAVVALAWRAELPMRLATQLQIRLAGIAPRMALGERAGQPYPMSDEDMQWQIEFFGG